MLIDFKFLLQHLTVKVSNKRFIILKNWKALILLYYNYKQRHIQCILFILTILTLASFYN